MTTPSLDGEALDEHIKMLLKKLDGLSQDNSLRAETLQKIWYLLTFGQRPIHSVGSYGGIFDPNRFDRVYNPPPDSNESPGDLIIGGVNFTELVKKLPDKRNQTNDE